MKKYRNSEKKCSSGKIGSRKVCHRRSVKNRKTIKVRKLRGGNGDDGKTHIVKITASWCGHCRSLELIWPDIIKAIESMNTNKYEFHEAESNAMVTVKGVEYKKMDKLLKDLNIDMEVKGYPTLLKKKGADEYTIYSGSRDKDSLIKWINE